MGYMLINFPRCARASLKGISKKLGNLVWWRYERKLQFERNFWEWSWWNDRFSKSKSRALWYVERNVWGAILMKRPIFEGYNHVRFDILNEMSEGRSWLKDRFSKFKFTCALILQTKCLRGDLNEKIDFRKVNSRALWYSKRNSGVDLDEIIDFHRTQSRAQWYFKRNVWGAILMKLYFSYF